jgi:hypothetical protein
MNRPSIIIGDRSRFALESAIKSVSIGGPLGHFCLWARAKPIGDFEDVVVLRGVQGELERSLSYSGARMHESLSNNSAKSVLDAVREGIFGDSNSIDDAIRSDRHFRRFYIGELGLSAFDGWEAALLEVPDGVRFIWSRDGGVDANEILLRHGEYEDLARKWLEWFGSIDAR